MVFVDYTKYWYCSECELKHLISEGLDHCKNCGKPLRKKRRGIIASYLDNGESEIEARLKNIEARVTKLENNL